VAWGLVALAGSLAWVPPTDVKVVPVQNEGRVLASFSAPAALTDEAEKVMRSGLPLTFTFTVELRRPSTLWFDHTLVEATAAASVRYDSLTAVYQVSKSLEGRVTWSEKTDKVADVRAWMTAFDQVPLEPHEPLESNADYYVQVRLHTTPRATFSLWPFGRDDGSGRASFTFIR
jgi:hypothetical protein